jgi:hypothetical protein
MINNVDYFSHKTSCNRIPSGIKNLGSRYPHYKVNLDYGGGRYDTATKYLANIGITNHVYDPYNRTEEHNRAALLHEFESVTLLNVLNVIADRSERIAVIKDAYSKIKDGGVFIIQIYEGKKSGVGAVTKNKTYQHNHRMEDYFDEIKEAVPSIKRFWLVDEKKHLIIIIKFEKV